MQLELDDGFYQCHLLDHDNEFITSSFLAFDGEIFYTGLIDRRVQMYIPPGEALAITVDLIRAAHFGQIDFMKIIFYPENDSLPIN